MPIRTQTADGKTHEFPDGTAPEVVDRAMKEYTLSSSGAAPAPEKPSALSQAFKPIADIPKDIGEEFRAGQQKVEKGISKEGGFGRPLLTALGGVQEFFSPVTGTAKALVGDPIRANLPEGKPSEFVATTFEDIAGMAFGVPFTKMMAKPFDLVEQIRTRVPESAENRAEAKILKRFEQDAKGGGVTAQSALDLVDAARSRGKDMTLADVSGPNVRGLAGNVARAPGPSKALAQDFVEKRDVGAGDRLTADVNKYVSTGSAYFTTQGLLEARSAGGHPLYEAAFEGGSIAPLEQQFETAFGESSKKVAEASQAVNTALNKMTLARGKQTTAGNVYQTSSGNDAVKAAQTELDAAEKMLNAAQEEKASVLDTLRQAQADGTANAKGAVWNPRINQFLKDPIAKGGIARGLEIQRLEALAENRPFNPTEYAIVGTDAEGNSIVGKVPNMRLLNAMKKGLDAIILDNQDAMTGRLNEKGRAVNMVRKAFLNEVDAINPEYKTARDFWSGKSKSMESVTWGRTMFSRPPEEISEDLAAMTPGDREFAKLGAADIIRERILKTGFHGDEAKSILKNDWAKRQIRPLFNSEKEFDEFVASVTDERRMKESKTGLVGNSATGERLAEDRQGGDLLNNLSGLHGVAQMAAGNHLSATHKLITWWRKRQDLGFRVDEELNEAVAKILFDPAIDPQRFSDPAVKAMRFKGKPDRSAKGIVKSLGPSPRPPEIGPPLASETLGITDGGPFP
jgi:hypothetical protein